MTADQSLIQPRRQLTASEFIDIITDVDRERYTEFYDGDFIIIEDVEIAEEILLTDDVIVNHWLIIRGGTFNGKFTIKGSKFKEDFCIQGGKFREDFCIEHSKFNEEFRIEGGEFCKDFQVLWSEFEKDFGISSAKFCGMFFIEKGKFKRDFSIGNNIFEREFMFMSGYICTLTISYLISSFRLIVGVNCDINSLLLYATVPKDSLLEINCNLYYLAFEGLQNFGSIVFNGLSFYEQPYVPEGILLPDDYDRPPSPEIQILNSDLGRTTFVNSDLSGFGLNFISSRITDVFVTGTKMPREITTKDDNENPDYPQRQLGYSQIKKIYEARGDRVEANRYYAREMDAYYSTLTWRNWDDFWEKLNLSLNKYSTNYGQSWQRGLGTTLLISAVFYGVYCWLLGYWPALPTGDHFNAFTHVVSYFLEFLNPIHKADYVAEQLLGEKAYVNGWARLTEGMSRIFIAYFVYQLIQAFRKHGKASS